MESSLSRDVQMQFMRPGQLEAAIRDFPVAYVPFGLIEWHGRHLPLGNDAIKAHAILVKCAEQFGGAVYPPQWLHNGFNQEHLVPVYTELFQKLKSTGFRVIIGISGHNVQGQMDMINKALEPVTEDGTAAGIGLWEMTLSQCDESNSDHAAKWETSNMMFFYPIAWIYPSWEMRRSSWTCALPGASADLIPGNTRRQKWAAATLNWRQKPSAKRPGSC